MVLSENNKYYFVWPGTYNKIKINKFSRLQSLSNQRIKSNSEFVHITIENYWFA